ncbi:glycine betaine ABC transporter substrate-binding protein [Natranaerofaba carboxydovora]|uniref:glycine betaine ABC transporter substrate-binding protein n=1 Tax=Natranaerofaba carboxydovora TaxID=2742683 RepID=UPI001F129E4D|nr:glycine betaine ABC transporter substrate-binding protein [Natranaerofaba carboxydovora]UMZ74368.1 Glycine betaine-binding protein OpuAC [Natranaerofaba carboxydovora]
MQRKLSILLIFTFLVGITLVSFTGCDEAEGQEEIQLPYADWSCTAAKTYVVTAILEEEMGYDVNLTLADLGGIFTDVAAGNQDFYMAAWLPITHMDYYEDNEEGLVDHNIVYENAKIGLVVPEYMDIDSIDELEEYKEELEGEITGIEPGAGLMQATESALEEYDSLSEFTLLDSSESGMVAELQSRYDNEEPIVVTGWTPHWKFAEWDLKFLEDPEGTFGEAEMIHAITRTGFEEEHPEVAELLSNFYVDDETLGELMQITDGVDNEDEAIEIVLEWMDENEDIVEGWLPQ